MKKTQLKNLAPGTAIVYRERAAVVLEHTGRGVFVQLTDSLGDFEFGSGNDWRHSSLRGYLNDEGARMITDGNLDDLLDTVTDLTALNGTADYGSSTDKVTLLTLDQCRKYRYIRPLHDNGEWTSTPASTPEGWDEEARYVVCLNTNGNISYNGASVTYGARPALTLPSDLTVDVPGGLEDYTDSDLLMELLQRRKQQIKKERTTPC